MLLHWLRAPALLLAITATAGGALPARPNILFLLSDDHSYPGLGAFGDPNVRTPNLDRLAAEGMKFHRFFVVAPQCVQSRAGLMTGRSAVAARMTRFSSPLPRDEIVFPEVLRSEAGYFTGVCGRRYHLDGPGEARYAQLEKIYAELNLATFPQRLDYVDVSTPADYAARVNTFFDRKPADRPFFLWMNFSDPHAPWNAKEHEPDPAALRIPGSLPDLPGVRQQLAAYCGEVNRLDGQVRQILDILTQRGFAANTLVVFAGDNGRDAPHGKGSLHDPGINTPLLVRWPGVVPPRKESRALISGEDLGPTLLGAAGVAVPARMTGVSFLPLLRGEPFAARRFLFAARGSHGGWTPLTAEIKSNSFDLSRCVRSDRYKLIYNATPRMPYQPMDFARTAGWREMVAADADGTLAPEFRRAYFTYPRPFYELYDLERDPAELVNLAGQPQLTAVEQELRAQLVRKMISDFDYLPIPGPDPADAQGAPAKVATTKPPAKKRTKK